MTSRQAGGQGCDEQFDRRGCLILLYIGASDILSDAHAAHPSLRTLGFTIAGTGLMYVTITLLR